MITASIEFTSDFLVESLQRYRSQHRGRYFGLTIKLLALALLAPIASWMFWQGHVLIGVLFAALSVFMFFAHHVDYWLARRSFRKSPFCDEKVVIEFCDAGFHARSSKSDSKLQWSAFTRVAYLKDGFLLFHGPKSFNWIPMSSLEDPSQAMELAALLRSKISEQKIVEQAGCTEPGGSASVSSRSPQAPGQ